MLNVLAEVFAIEKLESANALTVMKEKRAPEHLALTIAVVMELANLSMTSHTKRSMAITVCRVSLMRHRLSHSTIGTAAKREAVCATPLTLM